MQFHSEWGQIERYHHQGSCCARIEIQTEEV